MFLRLFHKLQREELFHAHPVRPVLPCYQKQRKTQTKIIHMSLMSIDAKALTETLANKIQQHIKEIILTNQVQLFFPQASLLFVGFCFLDDDSYTDWSEMES